MELVSLTEAELRFAEAIARRRDRHSTRFNDAPAHGAPTNGTGETLEPNLIGARGELAVAKTLGLYPNFSTRHEEKRAGGHDLEFKVNVRSAQKRYGLLVRRSDDPEARYVAAVVREATVLILGWEYGAEAQEDCWLRAPNGRPACFLVPEDHLKPLSDLAMLIADERWHAAAAHLMGTASVAAREP